MANPPRSRKRVFAVLRAQDGSAFQKCDFCGVSVAIALYDMHDCLLKREDKKFKSDDGSQSLKKSSVCDQPRSPFCIFMESFKKLHEAEDWLKVDQEGFETWKHMSMKEKYRFHVQAKRVISAYEQALLEEVDDELVVDDEADSAMVGKLDLDYEDWESSESFEIPQWKWDTVHSWSDCSTSMDQ